MCDRTKIETLWRNRFTPYLNRVLNAEEDFFAKALRDGWDKTYAALILDAFRRLYPSDDPETVAVELRRLKRKAALLIGAADLNGDWGIEKVTRALSLLAETCLKTALASLLRSAAQKGDLNLKDTARPERGCGLIVLAMGKLGARELNYSSDIDLIVLFDAEKTPYAGRRDVDSFCVRLTRNLIAMMEEKTAFGYVFRTDLRLRPDPGSTPVALSTIAAACYYESFAQNWERAAFIKARPVAGDKEAGEAFLKEISPFVWRKTTDFYALSQINAIKRSLGARSPEEGLAGWNVKIGRGGIREIEFFTQLQQLLWGGRDPSLRSRATLPALNALAAAGRIDGELKRNLSEAYVFLRTLEHRLQMVEDEQTQSLPKTAEGLAYIARLTGRSEEDFERDLNAYRTTVSEAYDGLFETETADGETLSFGGTDLPEQTAALLTEKGFADLAFIADSVRGWMSGRYRAVRSDQARELLSELLPALFKALSKTPNPDTAFARFDDFLRGLPSGVQLFSLFRSRPALLDLCAELFGTASSFASELAHRPNLLDAVLSPGFFTAFPSADGLEAETFAAVRQADGLEQAMDAVRVFSREKRFQAAVWFLRGLTDAERVGEALSDILQAALKALIPFVESDFERTAGKMPDGAFSLVAMGKAGSREMNFGSDLDLLFLYDAPPDALSDGRKALPPSVYYARLAQRIVSAISADTREGVLWPIDMRLRPSGIAGPAAVSLESFRKYYDGQAWTWEKMALTKARVLIGSVGKQEISAVLNAPDDREKIIRDVAEMRAKIAETKMAETVWDVKYAAGGMIDIEFFAQRMKLLDPTIKERSVRGILGESPLTEIYRLWQALSVLFSLCSETGTTIMNASPAVKKKVALLCGAASFEEAEKIVREKQAYASAMTMAPFR